MNVKVVSLFIKMNKSSLLKDFQKFFKNYNLAYLIIFGKNENIIQLVE